MYQEILRNFQFEGQGQSHYATTLNISEILH